MFKGTYLKEGEKFHLHLASHVTYNFLFKVTLDQCQTIKLNWMKLRWMGVEWNERKTFENKNFCVWSLHYKCKQSHSSFYIKSNVLVKIAESKFAEYSRQKFRREYLTNIAEDTVIVSAYFPNKYTCCANKWSDFIELVVISLNSDWFALIPVNYDRSQSVSII